MAARSNTLPDALALVEINNGWKHFVQPHVSSQMWEFTRYATGDEVIKTGRMLFLTDEGYKMLAFSPLWQAHNRLLGMGYERDRGRDPIRPRRASKRYIPYKKWNEETNRYDTAWISASRRKPQIWISRRQQDGGSYELKETTND